MIANVAIGLLNLQKGVAELTRLASLKGVTYRLLGFLGKVSVAMPKSFGFLTGFQASAIHCQRI